jgi:hypothetical protein
MGRAATWSRSPRRLILTKTFQDAGRIMPILHFWRAPKIAGVIYFWRTFLRQVQVERTMLDRRPRC